MQRTLQVMHHRQRTMSRSLLALRTLARQSLRSGRPTDFAEIGRLHARVEARDVLSVAAQVLRPGDRSAIADPLAADDDPLDRSRSGAECAATLAAQFR